MININQTSENSKIYIQRNITNDEPVINNYVTEDELQEILKEYNTVPYIVVDGFSFSGFEITKGDWGAVNNAIQNKKPYLIYTRSSNTGTIFSLVDDIIPHPQGGATIATTLISANKYVTYRAWIIDIDGNVELELEEKYTIQPKLVSGENIKTINGNDILGEGDIEIDVDLDSKQDKLVSGTNIKTINNTSVLGSGNIAVQPSLVSGNNIKTINGSSLLGSGDITIVGSGSEILYLYKATEDTAISTHKNHNISIRNKILSLTSTEQYPIIILKDWYNDTICNNVYARNGYVEIQCCNSRIFGEYSELTDERYELNNKGVLVKLEGNTFASKAYVDEQISNVSGGGGSSDLSNYYTKGEIDNMVGDIETILDNLIGNN